MIVAAVFVIVNISLHTRSVPGTTRALSIHYLNPHNPQRLKCCSTDDDDDVTAQRGQYFALGHTAGK